MSYARWGWDGSNVYVFDSARGGLECCACLLNEPEAPWREGDPVFPDSFITVKVDEMAGHLQRHRDAGHTVPDSVEPAIRADFPNGWWYDRLKKP